MEQTIRLLLAHGTESCRTRLRALSSAGDGLQLVGEAGCGGDALRLCRELAPQVLLLDACLSGPPVWKLVSQLRLACPGVHTILLCQVEDDVAVLRGLVAGAAAAHVLQQGQGEALLAVVRAVAQGRAVCGQQRAAQLTREQLATLLTARELQLIALAARGLTDCASACRLGISERGVRAGLQRARRKLGLGTRAELIAWAGRHGLG